MVRGGRSFMSSPAATAGHRAPPTLALVGDPCHNEITARPPAVSSSNCATNSQAFPTSPVSSVLFCRRCRTPCCVCKVAAVIALHDPFQLSL
ncbi:hypothetical protein BT93_C1549 [Corymbia citriodora subsp. variegata]|nr:hypothetical protein BT93_C1549 [Corymbia citriodora subsp. variegata]